MDFLNELRAAIGADCLQTGDAIEARHFGDYMVKSDAGPLAVALPRTADQVSAILRLCSAHRVPAVPQGGLTGLAGGATPVAGCVAVSLSRMRKIEEVDPAASTITVEAGVPLQMVQEAAEAAGLLFPLDIGSRGSCLIGGNISTNAGGNRVLRYGMARELVLGFEAVLADGTILTSLNKMQKNNAGYDLKQLFIGSEGTLGIVTRLVLRLFPQPVSSRIGLVALPNYAAVLDLLARARGGLGGTLSAFEVMWTEFYELATTAHGVRPPLPRGSAVYVLLEKIFGAAYSLWLVKRVIFGAVGNANVAALTDLNKREFFMLSLLALCVLAMGLYPAPFTDTMQTSVADLLQHVAVTKIK